MTYGKNEPLHNEFSRKSKKYRTRYMDELKNLYSVATRTQELTQDERLPKKCTDIAGDSKVS